ncbi:LysR family transcriptional regulator [Halotalea alkalilenta]|uniref:LysR substrate-binding domain-containing protein n=1 Tax=Halotalea alkalilenta TaxID=376489 RepID=UPI0009ED62A4|nr:LysR family transcriptional regulator [Halotalea alkalilenta]
MIDFRLLECFVAVAEHLHFRKAAVSLFISQPALTQQIKRLESVLKVQLFVRSTRAVFLTPAGELLLRMTKQLQTDTDHMVRCVRQVANGEGGFLKVGFTPTAACSSLAGAIHHFRSSRPDIDLELFELNSVEMVASLRERKLDIAIMRPVSTDPDVQQETLYTEPLLFCRRANSDKTSAHSVSLNDTIQSPLIEYDNKISPYFNDLLSRLFYERGLVPKYSYRSIIPTILSYVEMGVGNAIIPASLKHSRSGALAFTPISDLQALALTCVAFLKANENFLIKDLITSIKTFDFQSTWQI